MLVGAMEMTSGWAECWRGVRMRGRLVWTSGFMRGIGEGAVMGAGSPSGVGVILGTFGSGIKWDVMEGKPI